MIISGQPFTGASAEQKSSRENQCVLCEYEQGGEVYIIEPFSGGFLRRKSLPPSLYIRAEDIDVVREKIKAYHKRTGVYVNSAYRKLINAEMEPANPRNDRR